MKLHHRQMRFVPAAVRRKVEPTHPRGLRAAPAAHSGKDRSLAGKARIRARRATNQEEVSQ